MAVPYWIGSVNYSFPSNANTNFNTNVSGNILRLTGGAGTTYRSIMVYSKFGDMADYEYNFAWQNGTDGALYRVSPNTVVGLIRTATVNGYDEDLAFYPTTTITGSLPYTVNIRIYGQRADYTRELKYTTSITFVHSAPTITLQPSGLVKSIGESGNFNVTADSWLPYTYQWASGVNGVNFSNITNATGSIYSIPSITTGDLDKYYRVTLTNASGSTISNSALLATYTNPNAPTITTQPIGTTKNVGDYYTFTVTSPNATSYQWLKDGNNINGATNSSYFISYINAIDAGSYNVACMNISGTTYSSIAYLTVQASGAGNESRYSGSKYFISGALNSSLINVNDINVPVPIGSSGLPNSFWTNVYRNDGKDIVVTNLSGVPFNREIVDFDKTNKRLTMWVRFSGISSTIDTPFLIQYGSTQLNYTNDGVFTNNYSGALNHVMVSHFNRNGVDSSQYKSEWNGYVDPNLNNQWLTWQGAIIGSPSGYSTPLTFFSGVSKFDNSLDMNYNYQTNALMYAYVPPSDELSMTTGTADRPFTMRTWSMLKTGNVYGIDDTTFVSKGRQSRYGEYGFAFYGKKLGLKLYEHATPTLDPKGLAYCWMGKTTTANQNITADNWYHYAATYNGNKTNTSGMHLYINNSEVAATETRGDQEWSGAIYSGMIKGNADLELGRRVDVIDAEYTPYSYFYNTDTVIENIFILNGQMSSGELLTQYNLENRFNAGNVANYSYEQGFIDNPYIPPDDTSIPVITVPLINQTVIVGNPAIFHAEATGPAPLTYFWRKNSIPINGQTTPTLTINPVLTSSAGTYTFGVYNDNGVAYSNAVLTVVSSSGIVPTGVIPDPFPTGTIPHPTGVIDPDATGVITGLASSGYVFIDPSYAGITAEGATNIYQLDIGNMFYDDIKESRFLLGSLTKGHTNFCVYVSGVNSDIYNNLLLSKDQVNYYTALSLPLEYNEIKPVYIKYTVESNPKTGYGTLLIGVGELND